MNEIINEISTPLNITGSAKNSVSLDLIEDLLNAFHREDISYCHWKSNQHLDASMTGDTDLDVLFDEKQKHILELLLKKLGFKKFNSIKQKQYRDIEDYIGLDQGSGKVVHLHTHFRLTLGEPFLKSYQLDFEDNILTSRVFDETYGIYTINPSFELVLLWIRESLKLRNRDILRMYLKNKIQYSGNILNEYNWLKERTSDLELKSILQNIFDNYEPVYGFITGKFDRREMLKLSGLIKKEYKKYRLYSAPKALILRWYREVSVKVYKKTASFLNRPILSHRINPRGGLIIAVIGADGSGKSSVIKNLKATFSNKLDVYRIYFGRGDGRISFSRKMLLNAKGKLDATPTTNHSDLRVKQTSSEKKNGFIANIYKCLMAFLVANEKRRNFKLMKTAKNKGMLVICDRFPQNQVMGYNDGPLLNHLAKSKNPIFKALSSLEAKIYAKAENNPPDVLFKLIADASIVEARKPNETPLESLKKKIEGVKKIQFRNCEVVTVDAAQPFDVVLSEVKKKIWEVYP